MKISLLFPGQGAQYVGMGKELYDQYGWIRDIYKEIGKKHGWDISQLCFYSENDLLTRTDNAQVAIFIISYINYLHLKSLCSFPVDYMAGHSLGEFTALAASGALSFDNALELVIQRGKLMQFEAEKSSGSMIAIRSDIENVSEIKKEIISKHPECQLSISNYNTVNQIVFSGDENSINIAVKAFDAYEIMTTRLNVGAAFHSEFMKNASVKFSELLTRTDFSKPECKIISNVTGLPYMDNMERILSKQMVSTVQWYKTISYMENEGVDIYIDMGPKDMLKKMCKKSISKGKIFSYEKDLKELIDIIG